MRRCESRAIVSTIARLNEPPPTRPQCLQGTCRPAPHRSRVARGACRCRHARGRLAAAVRAGRLPNGFLLESVEGGERWARYSFLGGDSFATVKAIGDDLMIEGAPPVKPEAGEPASRISNVSRPSAGLPPSKDYHPFMVAPSVFSATTACASSSICPMLPRTISDCPISLSC